MDVVTTLPRSRPLTVEDLETMPDDGHRYELIDGTLIVSPAPSDPHQSAVVRLIGLLLAACPDDSRVRTAPYDVVLGERTLVQPDVLVVRKADITRRGVQTAPVLAVEVLSPSTRSIDLTLKMETYRAAGLEHYWVVDPDEPRLRAWQLREGEYVEIADVSGSETFAAETPCRVAVVPNELID